ncbi:AMP-binding protein [Desulfobulbus sp.]|uniref:AMP-binding protein n=1 Tax=Desulfobulbus sp. TaxID=895 RepID=UPI00286ED795|nr:AMP-binding protein [Desulfobulbus sp.]
MNVVELLAAQAEQRGNQLALCHGSNSITFRALHEQSCRGSAMLRSLGFEPGDAVLVFVPMSIDLYCILLSLWRLGMTAMFVDPSADAQTMQACCARAKPRGFIGTPLAQLLRLKIPALRSLSPVLTTGWLPFHTCWSAASRWSADFGSVACTPETPALITFTSGTTGTPKGTVRTHGFLLAQKRVLEKTLKLQAGKADLATLPIFALINLACGVTTIIPQASLKQPAKVSTRPILADCARFRPATAVASPAFFARLLEDPRHTQLRCLESLYTGGAPVFPGLLKKLATALPGTAITAVYGSTEAEPIAELHFGDISDDDYRRMTEGGGLLAGTVVAAIDCRIMEECRGRELGRLSAAEFRGLIRSSGEVGEIVVQGEHVLTGYLDGIGDGANKFSVEGSVWHRTGDLGYFDANGRLWLLGRCSAAIRDARGVAYPFAIETAARQFEQIAKAAFCQVGEDRVLIIETHLPPAEADRLLEPLIKGFQLDRLVLGTIPMDRRHNAKVNYPELRKRLASS